MLDISIKEAYNLRSYKGDVGIEIEIEGESLPDHMDDWRVEYDGSLKANEAYEYITSTPVYIDDIQNHISVFEQSFKYKGGEIYDSVRAGVHVHVNVQNMSHTQVCTFATVYYIFENVLLDFCGDSRNGNFFCLKVDDAFGVMIQLQKSLNHLNFMGMHTDNVRYAALNWKPVTEYGSLEFRAFKTPTELYRVAIWAEILYKVKEYSLKFKTPLHALLHLKEMLKSNSQDYVIRNVFSEYSGYLLNSYNSTLNLTNATILANMVNWVEFEQGVTDFYNTEKTEKEYKKLFKGLVIDEGPPMYEKADNVEQAREDFIIPEPQAYIW